MQPVTASIITIGDELLIGQTIDTNSAWIAQELNKIGIWVKRRVAVGDVRNEIRKALEIDPNMGVAWGELACVYSFAGEDIKAQEAQNNALKLRDRLSRKEKQWIDAISLWLDGSGPAFRAAVEKFVSEFPDDRNGYFYIGLGWQWLDHDCKNAIPWYDKAYTLTPDYYPITKALVDCQIDLNQRRQAISSLQRYQKIVPSGYGFDQAKWRLEKLQR